MANFLVNNIEHEPGQHKCLECWSTYPKLCECSGLIHAQFVKENWQGELSLVFSCDKCGDQFKQWIPKAPKKKRFSGRKRR